MFRDAKMGFQHSIPLSTNFKVFKFFSATTSVNYNEVWYFKTLKREFNSSQDRVVDTEVQGFDAFRTYSLTAGLGTTIYGTFNFGEKKKIQAIRHVMRPNISYSYTPSFAQYYDTYDPDGSGTMRKEYTRFDNGIFGAPGKNMSNNIGFNLSNTFEAKITDKDSTKTEPKKLMLLNNLNFSTSYDITADSLRWSPMRISGGTLLFKQKMNVNFAATLDPYAINNSGDRINTWNIDNGGSLFRMTSANMTMNYSFTSRGENNENKNKQGERNGGREDDLFGTNKDLGDLRTSQFQEDENTDGAISDFFKYT
jgi:hypothetical protein